MKNMKKMSALVLAGVLIASSVISVSEIKAAEENQVTPKTAVASNEMTIHQAMLMNMETYINSLTILTEQEKQQLIQTEREVEPKLQALDAVNEKIDDKLNQAFRAIKLYERYEALETKHEAIWEKLYQNISEKDLSLDEVTRIKRSKGLNQKEKNILLKELKALKKLDKIAEAKEKEVLAKEKKLVAQAKKIEQEIEAMHAKNQAIWDKVTEDARANGKTDNPSVIPYDMREK